MNKYEEKAREFSDRVILLHHIAHKLEGKLDDD